MAESRRIIKVFLASPGDMEDERNAAKTVADDFNTTLANAFGSHVELIGWEDTIPGYGRPQEIINRDLESCEVFVGMMWKRWGTPPAEGGPYTSGFEEEYSISVQRREEEGKPEIIILFKDIEQEFLNDPGPDLKKVLGFTDKLKSERKIFYKNFASIRDFERVFNRCITNYILKNSKSQEVSESPGISYAKKTDSDHNQDNDASENEIESPFSEQGSDFLAEFIPRTNCVTDTADINPADVARFRLIANLIGKQGNDDLSLGAHDANLLYLERDNSEFGVRELAGLIKCGLDNYQSENTPLWYWYEKNGGFISNLLSVYSVAGQHHDRKIGAFSAMRLVSEPLPSLPEFGRENFLKSWFGEDSSLKLQVAALGYLGECGFDADLDVIRLRLESSNNEIITAAADAIIRISLRDSCEKAIGELFALQPATIEQGLLGDMFNSESTIKTEILEEGLDHNNSMVRRAVVILLNGRGELSFESAEKLVSDSDASIRYEAVKALIGQGKQFSNKEVQSILVKNETNNAFLMQNKADIEGEKYWKKFYLEYLRTLDDDELETKASYYSLFKRDAQFVLAERHFGRLGDRLRGSVDNQFKDVFEDNLRKYIEKFGKDDDLIDKVRSLESSIRRDLSRRGLDVLCRKANKEDLWRVRDALKNDYAGYSDLDIEYLRRYGEWEDIQLIIDAIQRPNSDGGFINPLMIYSNSKRVNIAAQTIYVLGRSRISELLKVKMPGTLLVSIIYQVSKGAFNTLNNNEINNLLRSENIAVRKAVAIKCIQAFPKKKIKEILSDYSLRGEQYYYNVIHWLDFGVSVPQVRVYPAIRRILSNS